MRKKKNIRLSELEQFIFKNSQMSDIEAGPTNDFNNIVNALARADPFKGPIILYYDKFHGGEYGRSYYRLYQRMNR